MIIDSVARPRTPDHNVAVLTWPTEAAHASRAKREGKARLLLVASDNEPPHERDLMTDWVRLPVTPEEVTARVDALDRHVRQWMPPRVDEYDVVWRGEAWCALAPIEATIVRVLIERSPRVAGRREIGRRVWPNGMPAGRPVDRRLQQIRARLGPLGLRIQTIRQRGLLLVIDPPATTGAHVGSP